MTFQNIGNIIKEKTVYFHHELNSKSSMIDSYLFSEHSLEMD